MAIDDTSVTEGYTTNPSEGSGHGPKFIAIFLVLAALAIGEIYTLSQLSSIHSSVQNEQARVQKDIGVQLEDQISSRLSAIQRSNAQQFEALKKVVGTGTKRVGSGGDSKRTRELVAKLEKEQVDQAEMLKQQRFNLALQADDMVIEKKDRTINEPVIFYVHGAKKPYELVINKVLSDRILGYLSAPKGATEVAATQTGGSR